MNIPSPPLNIFFTIIHWACSPYNERNNVRERSVSDMGLNNGTRFWV